jgi:DNA modification methylase
MELNTVHNIDFLNNDLPDKCANLIIADPPYYKVKGEFDFIWKTFDDYLKDVEKWAVECKRILADNGTLLWYGDAKNIAYAQIIFDKHFDLLNSIVWENTNDHKQQIRFNEDLRTFAPLTERILMYGKENEQWDTEISLMHEDENNFKSIKEYLWNETDALKMTWKEINRDLLGTTFEGGGGRAYNMLSRTRKRWDFPDKENYLKLQKSGRFQKKYEDLRAEYEDLRTEYELKRRPFNNSLHLGDVIRLPNYETSNYDHDTVKPEKLTRIFITTCSRKNDLVVVPFAGSGTECAMSAKEKRNFVGFEITEKHAKMANERAKKILKEPTLF